LVSILFFFFFNDTATTEIYTLSLHDALPISWFMQRLNVPNGLSALGYTASDIPALVEGTLPQHRVTKLSPRPAGPDDLARLFEQALVAW